MKIPLLILLSFLVACEVFDKNSYKENRVIDIDLGADMSNPKLQISGLDWYGEQLVLLTQIPSDFNSKLYSVSKKDILQHLKDSSYKVKISEIYLDDNLVSASLDHDNEYEAIAFKNDTVFMAIETDVGDKMQAWLVKGQMVTSDTLKLKESCLIKIPLPENNIHEMACETIVIINNSIYAFYEANGANLNKQAICYKLDRNLSNVKEINFDHIEYRLTDATRVDDDNKFWVINNFYKGDIHSLKPVEDSFIPKTIGSVENEVKRLVQLQLHNNRISIATNKTIILDPVNCNWEGLARLDDLGFLIANDTYAPDRKRTRLAFIKPNK
ncbi:MAG: hypothetical protein D8M58_19825 [Calditrichaeota bacterium]|nr:MAG: hypothetical protein DWQ03_14570 [Calditrichota bacterium]MBL1207659.1 hypothetical protein [Calditrichota bacterium]NOG47492.1 hypothetical protein [Calditrichota bacterium]